MAHFAKINDELIVEEVLVVSNEALDPNDEENSGQEFLANLVGGAWIQTSYNGTIRKNYAGIGFTYDPDRDAFIEPKPYPSWILDETTCRFVAPIPYPNDGELYYWNEDGQEWSAK